MNQLAKLAKPFPDRLIKKIKGKFGSHVEHGTVNEALLAILGPFDFHIKEIVRGSHEALENVVVAVVCSLTATIDGRVTTVEEVGDCEDPANWKNDGARLKDAVSDGIKRCSVRIGLGLHLRSQADYFLDQSLAKQNGQEDTPHE